MTAHPRLQAGEADAEARTRPLTPVECAPAGPSKANDNPRPPRNPPPPFGLTTRRARHARHPSRDALSPRPTSPPSAPAAAASHGDPPLSQRSVCVPNPALPCLGGPPNQPTKASGNRPTRLDRRAKTPPPPPFAAIPSACWLAGRERGPSPGQGCATPDWREARQQRVQMPKLAGRRCRLGVSRLRWAPRHPPPWAGIFGGRGGRSGASGWPGRPALRAWCLLLDAALLGSCVAAWASWLRGLVLGAACFVLRLARSAKSARRRSVRST